MVEFELVPIGTVHSPVSDRRLMPQFGVPAEIHLFPGYADGLLLIEENSHILVVAWFQDADRDRLQIIRPTYEPSRRRRGVFGLRSTARPNSIAVTPARLLEVAGPILRLQQLDLIDGTPVVDLKRYSPSYDAIFSARSSRDRYLLDKADPSRMVELEVEASHFHGALTPQIVLGARLIQYVSLNWNIMPKAPELQVCIGTDPEIAVLVDAVQALTAATFGTGRLRAASGRQIVFTHGQRRLAVTPLPISGVDLATLRTTTFGQLFHLNED